MEDFLRIGHRGASGHEPENTLRSIRRALELGANGIEIDVRLTRDGQLAVIHDANLKRVTGVAGTVSLKTLAELRTLNAGCGERIPTLWEVLELLAGRCWLNIELKARGSAAPVAREINGAVKSGKWSFDQIVVSSFDRRELAFIDDPRIRVGVLIARRPLSMRKLIERLRAGSVHLPFRLATPPIISRIHAAGALALVFTVNEAAEIARLRKMGVDGVFTDYPERSNRR